MAGVVEHYEQLDESDRVKDGIAVGNATAVRGQCPSCGAGPLFTAGDQPGVLTITFLHDPACPVAELLDQEP